MLKSELIKALFAIPGDLIVLCSPNGFESDEYGQIHEPVLAEVDGWTKETGFGKSTSFHPANSFRNRECVEIVDAIVLE